MSSKVPFKTTLSLAKELEYLYIQSTLPNGTKMMCMVPVRDVVNVTLNGSTEPLAKMSAATTRGRVSSMPEVI